MNTRQSDPADETETLRARLVEAEDTLRAIRRGEIDAIVVEGDRGSQVYTLHSADEPYRNLVEQMQEGALVLTLRGDILYSNAQFAALVGHPLESVVGSGIDRFVGSAEKINLAALLSTGSGRQRSRLIGPGATAFEVSLSLTTVVSPAGDRLNLIVTDLRELLEANSHRVRAERESQAKDQFLAVLAHELRTPLSAITTAAHVLESALPAGEPATAAQEVIARQVGHISHLINDLLDVESVVSGNVKLNRQPLDLGEKLRQAIAPFIGDSRWDWQIDIPGGPMWIDWDAVRLQQVLANIATNAVKYTKPGGRIRFSLCADGVDTVLSVQDTGVGISPEVLPFVFGMYVQADRTLDRAQGGLGIGLALVQRLVELHGGTVVASSEGEGRGSTFTLRLRQVPPPVASGRIPIPVERRVSVPSERRVKARRVLLIEDGDDARAMLRMMLELAGHEVYDAADGPRGLELMKVMCPDVGIIDLGLPQMDGYQVAQRIREEPYGREMLLVALTGYDSSEDARRSSEHGFDYHLVKPVNPEHLARLIGQAASAS